MAGVDDPVGQYGEKLFAKYLAAHGLLTDYEPKISGTAKRVDHVISSPDNCSVNAEVKTIWHPPPQGSGVFDPYRAIRSHIDIGREKFKDLKGSINVLVFTAFPGSFVDLSDPHNMLGSMVGNYGFTIPFDPLKGSFDSSRMQGTFLPGDGLMVRRTIHRNTRISALVTLHNADSWFPRIPQGGLSIGEAQRLIVARLDEPNLGLPYVTVWENPIAEKKLPGTVSTARAMAAGLMMGKHLYCHFEAKNGLRRVRALALASPEVCDHN